MVQKSLPPETVAAAGALAVGDAPQLSQAAVPLANQVAEQSMMCTNPVKRSTDASQRSPACASWLGAAAAGGDASQRNPIGRVSLGVAVIGGDASQRSPPRCTNLIAECGFGEMCSGPMPMQQNYAGSSMAGHSIQLNPSDASWPNSCSGNPQGITGTRPAVSSPDSSCSSAMLDASQWHPAGSVLTNLTVDDCNDALKSWLSGGNGSSVSGVHLAEQLRAAAPESYED